MVVMGERKQHFVGPQILCEIISTLWSCKQKCRQKAIRTVGDIIVIAVFIKGSLVEKLPIYEQDRRIIAQSSHSSQVTLSQVTAQSSHSSVKSQLSQVTAQSSHNSVKSQLSQVTAQSSNSSVKSQLSQVTAQSSHSSVK